MGGNAQLHDFQITNDGGKKIEKFFVVVVFFVCLRVGIGIEQEHGMRYIIIDLISESIDLFSKKKKSDEMK